MTFIISTKFVAKTIKQKPTMKKNYTAKASINIYAPVEKVWDALTNPAIIKKYFFGTNANSNWKVGGELTFTGEYQGKQYQDKGKILDMDENRLFKYTYWSSMSGKDDKPENYVEITYQLFPDGDMTTLRVTQEGIPNTEMREHSEQNWNMVLKNLKNLMEKQPSET